MILRVPGHPFSGILLLNNPALLRDLKVLDTIDPNPELSTPTGIPPHIHQAKLTKSCLELCKLTLTEVEKMSSHVKKAVCDAFKANASKNGILTMQTLAEMLTVHHNQIETLITTRLTALHQTAIPAKALVLVNQGLHDDFELAHGVTR